MHQNFNPQTFLAKVDIEKLISKNKAYPENEVTASQRLILPHPTKRKDHLIWPRSEGKIDAFAINRNKPAEVYLNSARDVSPRLPIITKVGRYTLHYEAFANDFPVTKFALDLNLKMHVTKTTVRLGNSRP